MYISYISQCLLETHTKHDFHMDTDFCFSWTCYKVFKALVFVGHRVYSLLWFLVFSSLKWTKQILYQCSWSPILGLLDNMRLIKFKISKNNILVYSIWYLFTSLFTLKKKFWSLFTLEFKELILLSFFSFFSGNLDLVYRLPLKILTY